MTKKKDPKNMTVSEILQRKEELNSELQEINSLIQVLLSKEIRPSHSPSHPFTNYIYDDKGGNNASGNNIAQTLDNSFSMPIGSTIDPYSAESYESLKDEVASMIEDESNKK